MAMSELPKGVAGKKMVSQDALEEGDQGVILLQLQPGHTIAHPV